MGNQINKLINSGKERERLTKKTIKLAADVATQIANAVAKGTEIKIKEKTITVRWISSKIGTFKTIGFLQPDGSYKYIADWTPDEGFYLHNDFDTYVKVCNKDEFMFFIKHLREIIENFAIKNEEIIAEIKKAIRKAYEDL